MKKIIALLLIATQAWAGNAPTNTRGQNDASPIARSFLVAPSNQFTDLGANKALLETGNDNVLSNPNFQATGVTSSVVPKWSIAGAGVTAATSTNPQFGTDPQVLQLTLSAATGDLLYQDVSAPTTASFSRINLEQSLWVYAPTSGVTLQVCPRLSGSDVSGACVSVPNIGGWVYVPSAGSVGGTGSAGVSLNASVSSTGTVYVAKAYVGRTRLLGNVGGFWPEYAVTVTGTGWTTNRATGTPYQDASGVWHLRFNISGAFAAQASSNIFILSVSGVTFKNTSGHYQAVSVFNNSAQVASMPSLSASAQPNSGSINVYWNGTVGFNNAWSLSGDVELESLPTWATSSTSQTVVSLANATSLWSGKISGTWTHSSGGQSDFGAGSGISLSSGTSLNFGTVSAAGSSLPGITFTNSRLGAYLICATPEWAAGSSVQTQLTLTDGSAVTIPGSGPIDGPATTSTVSNTACGVANYGSSAAQTVKVQGNGGATITLTSISFSVTALSASTPQPYATGNQSSTGSGQYHTESINLTCSSSSSITNYTPGTAWTIGNISSGKCTVTIPSGEFSSANYGCAKLDNGTSVTAIDGFRINNKTATSFDIYGATVSSGSSTIAAATSFTTDLVCVGPH